MKILTIVFLATSAFSLNIPITVQEALPGDVNKGIARLNEPVTVGIPLSENDNIREITELGLSGVDAAQFRVLSRYHPSGKIKWVLLDFLASVEEGGTSTVILTDGSGPFGGNDLAEEGDSGILVNTGTSQFTVKKSNFNIFQNVTVDAISMLTGTGGLTSVDSAGIEYSSTNDDNSSAVIEDNGPVKAVIKCSGRLKTTTGEGHLWYTARLFFFRGASYAKMQVTFRNADLSLTKPLAFNSLSAVINLASPGDPTYTFTGQNATDLWTGKLTGNQTAYIYQGFNSRRLTPHEDDCYIWREIPVAGTCNSSNRYTYDAEKVGLEVFEAGTALESRPNDMYTRGWGDLSNDSQTGVSFALRWMASYWPTSFEVDASGKIEISLYSKYNDKTPLHYNWGAHDTREIIFDFHNSSKNGEATLYRLEYPLVARAAFSQYRNSGAFFNQTHLVTNEEERKYLENHGYSIPSYLDLSNPGLSIRRIEHWRRGYSEHERDLLEWVRTGMAGFYLSGEQQVKFNADFPTVHSDGFDMRDQPTDFRPEGTLGQNTFDAEHQETMSFPMYYYMSGDERVREAILDYGEWLAWLQNAGSYRIPNTSYFRAWCRRFRNHAWLFEFTRDTNYFQPVLNSVDFLLDNEDEAGNCDKRGQNPARGNFYMNTEFCRQIHSFFGAEIFGEASWQVLRILRQYNDVLQYDRVEDFEDALLGHAQFLFLEAGMVHDEFLWIPYDYNLDEANDRNEFEQNPYLGSRFLAHIYEMLGNLNLFEEGAQIIRGKQEYTDGNHFTILQNQALMYLDLHRPPPYYGWKKLPVNATNNGDGSYTLSWNVPKSVIQYKIKYSEREIVDWLGFNQATRQFNYDPADYTPFFAAKNISNEPAPADNGTNQTFVINGLNPDVDYHFDLRYSDKSPSLKTGRGAQTLTPTLSASPSLFQNFTRIDFVLPEATHIDLALYDISGKKIRVLSNGFHLAGEHHFTWNGKGIQGKELPNGFYFVGLHTPTNTQSFKLVKTR